MFPDPRGKRTSRISAKGGCGLFVKALLSRRDGWQNRFYAALEAHAAHCGDLRELRFCGCAIRAQVAHTDLGDRATGRRIFDVAAALLAMSRAAFGERRKRNCLAQGRLLELEALSPQAVRGAAPLTPGTSN
jgi:hypothetical protein